MAKRYYNNSGYKGGRNDSYKRPYRDDAREFERKPQYNERRETRSGDTLDVIRLERFKKQNILIVDMNGKEYVIDGSFAVEYTSEIADNIDEAVKLEKIINDEKTNQVVRVSKVKELLGIYKNWCLTLINHNIDGAKYTMDDVNRGFNDPNALKYLIGKILTKTQQETANMVKETNAMVKGVYENR